MILFRTLFQRRGNSQRYSLMPTRERVTFRRQAKALPVPVFETADAIRDAFLAPIKARLRDFLRLRVSTETLASSACGAST